MNLKRAQRVRKGRIIEHRRPIENYCHWYDQECPECGEELRVNESMPDEVECGECEAEIERAPVPEDDIPDAVLEWRERATVENTGNASGSPTVEWTITESDAPDEE